MGEFLVYAYLFGIYDEVINELRNIVPELFQQDAAMAATGYHAPWWYVYSTHSMMDAGSLNSFADSFTKQVNESFSAISSALSGSFSMSGGDGAR